MWSGLTSRKRSPSGDEPTVPVDLLTTLAQMRADLAELKARAARPPDCVSRQELEGLLTLIRATGEELLGWLRPVRAHVWDVHQSVLAAYRDLATRLWYLQRCLPDGTVPAPVMPVVETARPTQPVVETAAASVLVCGDGARLLAVLHDAAIQLTRIVRDHSPALACVQLRSGATLTVLLDACSDLQQSRHDLQYALAHSTHPDAHGVIYSWARTRLLDTVDLLQSVIGRLREQEPGAEFTAPLAAVWDALFAGLRLAGFRIETDGNIRDSEHVEKCSSSVDGGPMATVRAAIWYRDQLVRKAQCVPCEREGA